MSKSTELPELEYAWHEQMLTARRRTHSASGYLEGGRWREIFHGRRLETSRKKAMGRASKVAIELSECQFWANTIRRNRKLLGLSPQVFRFGSSGRAIQ